MLLTGYAGTLSPEKAGLVSLAGYAFPLALIANVGMLVFCTLFCRKAMIIPILGLLAAYGPVTLYCPINRPQAPEPDEITLKVISYNTLNMGLVWPVRQEGEAYTGDISEIQHEKCEEMLNYLADSGADILCLQEVSEGAYETEKAKEILQSVFTYADSVHSSQPGNASRLWIYSRYPIVRKQEIKYLSQGNMSCAFWVNINGRETIIVNNHLETMGITIEEREEFSSIMHGERKESEDIKGASRTIFGKILEASKVRAPQAEAVASFVRMHKDTPLILCGDFNDIPQSYTHHVIAAELTDCFQAAAFGPNYTFSRYGMRVRIDNILCSTHFTPLSCAVDASISLSDHYPVRCTFRIN